MARSPFIADIVALRRHQGHREHLAVRAPLTGLRVTASEIPRDEPVDLELQLEAVEGGIVVTGTARARWAGECRRCLQPVDGDRQHLSVHSGRWWAGRPSARDRHAAQPTSSA